MKPRTQARVALIRQAISAGTSRTEIISNMSKEMNLSPGRIGNLITLAYKEMEDETLQLKEVINEVRREEANAVRDLILSELEVLERLSAIIKREVKEEKAISTANGVKSVMIAPAIREVLTAIEIYQAMPPSKSYVPHDIKKETT